MTCTLYDFKRIKICEYQNNRAILSATFSEFCGKQKHHASPLRHSASPAGNKNTKSFCDTQRILRETKTLITSEGK